jgi:hypothetical protein
MATQFQFWEYKNQNQIFILDFHQPFICSARLILFRFLSPSMWLLFYAYRILGLGKKVVGRCPFHNSPAVKYNERHIIKVNFY